MLEFVNKVLAFIAELIPSIPKDATSSFVIGLMIVLFFGLIGGIAAKWLKQPLIIGYILSGVVFGVLHKYCVPEAIESSVASQLADTGVALLLFSMGLEFAKDDIKKVKGIAIWGSLAQVAFTLIAGAVIAWFLSRRYQGLVTGGLTTYLLFGTAFVSTSTAVILKTLTSAGKMETLSSKVMIGVSIVQDLTVMPLMLLICNLNNLSHGLTAAVTPLICGGIFMALIMIVGPKVIPSFLDKIAVLQSKELFLLAVTGIALGCGALAQYMKLSFSFGSFLAGIVLSDSIYGKKALSELMPVRDLFAMLFFVSIGMMLDVGFLMRNFLLIAVMVFACNMTRTVFLAVVSRLGGYKNVIPVAMFFGMFPTSEMAFVVLQTGQTNGVFTVRLATLILCVVVCSMILGPIIDSLTAPVYKFLRNTIWKGASANDIQMPELNNLRDHVVVVGGGKLALVIAYVLQGYKQPYVVIESGYTPRKIVEEVGLCYVQGDPQQEAILAAGRVEKAKLLLFASEDVTECLNVTDLVRKMNPQVRIIARADDENQVKVLEAKGITTIVLPKVEAGLELTRYALTAVGIAPGEIQNYLDSTRKKAYSYLSGDEWAQFHPDMQSFSDLVDLSWIRVPETGSLVGRTIAESAIRARYGISVAGYIRNGLFKANPHPDYQIQSGDILAIMGTNEDQREFSRIMGAELNSSPSAADTMEAISKV